jgi:hypothetical protein
MWMEGDKMVGVQSWSRGEWQALIGSASTEQF